MIELVLVSRVLTSERGAGVAAAPEIDRQDASQRDYWSYRLNVSQDDLFTAIAEVGTSVAAIRRHLGK
jgi:hypothetical protein